MLKFEGEVSAYHHVLIKHSTPSIAIT